MTEYTNHLSIPSWAEEDRPREKMLQKGPAALTDAELIAILLRIGSKSLSAVELAKKLLQQADNNLNELARKSLYELQKQKGMGEAKALTVLAAMEIGRRRAISGLGEKPKINNSRDAWFIMMPDLLDQQQEQFWVLMLNRSNAVIKKALISKGGITGTVADPRLIFREAIESSAVAIIVVHNHPSGNLFPSQADKTLTQKLVDAGKILQIPVLDHIIFADQGHYSFADEGIL